MSSVPVTLADSAPAKRRRIQRSMPLFTGDHRPQAVGVADLPTAKEIRLERIEPDPDSTAPDLR